MFTLVANKAGIVETIKEPGIKFVPLEWIGFVSPTTFTNCSISSGSNILVPSIKSPTFSKYGSDFVY